MNTKTFKFLPGDVVYTVRPLNNHTVIDTLMVSKVSFTKDRVDIYCRSLVANSAEISYSEKSLLTGAELLEDIAKNETNA